MRFSTRDGSNAVAYADRTSFPLPSTKANAPAVTVNTVPDEALLQPGAWHKVEVRLWRNQVRILVEGREFAKGTWPANAGPESGYIGLVAGDAAIRVRNFDMREEQGKWEPVSDWARTTAAPSPMAEKLAADARAEAEKRKEYAARSRAYMR